MDKRECVWVAREGHALERDFPPPQHPFYYYSKHSSKMGSRGGGERGLRKTF